MMPVDAAPAEVDVLRVVAQDEGRRIGGVVGRGQAFLLAQGGDVARLLRDAVPDTGLVGVTGVENHDALVGQHHKRRVVVVVGLEVATNEHVGLAMLHPVILSGFHVAMHVNIANIGGIDGSAGILIVQGTRIGKPAPCTFVGHDVLGKGT